VSNKIVYNISLASKLQPKNYIVIIQKWVGDKQRNRLSEVSSAKIKLQNCRCKSKWKRENKVVLATATFAIFFKINPQSLSNISNSVSTKLAYAGYIGNAFIKQLNIEFTEF
jgi:hypothetical protein